MSEEIPEDATPPVPATQGPDDPPPIGDFVLELPPNKILNERYKIVKKLGAGQHSTVWLAADSKSDPPNAVRAIKVLTSITTDLQGTIAHELETLQTVRNASASSASNSRPGVPHALQLLDHFTITFPHGTHLALVTRVLGNSVEKLQGHFEDRMVHPELARALIRHLLHALAFLHDECKIVHTDIKPDNIMADDYEDEEPQSVREAVSQALNATYVLTDFSTAEPEHGEHKRLIQPEALRCPEVVAELEWGTAADIWNVGCLVFELITGRVLFQGLPEAHGLLGITRTQWQFAHFWSFARTPDDTDEKLHEFFSRSEFGRSLFDADDGKLAVNVSDKKPLDKILLNYEVDDPELADFLQCMLRLLPGDRLPARELVKHPWLSKVDSLWKKDSDSEDEIEG